jgi:hypothetical protein
MEIKMAETDLQIATRETSDQKHAVLRQHAVVLSLQREGGPKLERAIKLLDSLRDELVVKEIRLERLMIGA